MCAALPPERWTLTSDTLILHGRPICRPKPLCDECAVRDECDYFRTVIARERERPSSAKKPKARPATRASSKARPKPKTQPKAKRSAGGAKRIRKARR